jgi:hypothetical protein
MADHCREVPITSKNPYESGLSDKVGNDQSLGNPEGSSPSRTSGSRVLTTLPNDTFSSVAELFAAPPEWLPNQLKVYRGNPDKHFKSLCAAVAAVLLGDGLRWEEVAYEVEREV